LDELRAGDPRQVGSYTLLARLGSGGMGQVYYGRSPGGRHVAVKVIRADLARDQSFRARFGREVEAARRVSGAFTAPVIDADPDAPVPWLVTGYVNGPSLAEAVQRHGPLPIFSVLTLAAGLAEGLGAVHAAGVIHRDLKPANVLLAEDGPRLIDFGISQAADFAQITSPTSVLGTPGFIAPELLQGGPVGPASDIFTMGAVLAYAATGELVFGTGPADARTLRVLYLAPDLDKVPAGLGPLLERCLAKDPAERPTAGEFLTSLVADHPEAADRDDWLPAGILAEIRQRPLPQARPDAGARHDAGVSPGRAVTMPPSDRRRRRAWAAGLTAALAVIGAIVIGLVGLSGNAPRQAVTPAAVTPVPVTTPAAVPSVPVTPAPASTAVEEVGFDWSGTADLKEVSSSDGNLKAVGATWTEYWTFITDCVLQQPCGAALNVVMNDDVSQFNATLSRHGFTYAGKAAIDNYWTCPADNQPLDSVLYITLTGKSTGSSTGPEVTSFTGVLKWDVSAGGKCPNDYEYDMQVHST
jgi:hypothetical protein